VFREVDGANDNMREGKRETVQRRPPTAQNGGCPNNLFNAFVASSSCFLVPFPGPPDADAFRPANISKIDPPDVEAEVLRVLGLSGEVEEAAAGGGR
jgi:hypothetical protein